MTKIKVFIENEAGSNKKNLFNEKTLEYIKTVELSREYPYPYGFILNTTSGDGDNVDCFIITNKQLKAGSVIECEIAGLMEQRETSWDPLKNNIEEEDYNILATVEDDIVDINNEVKEKLRDFILHVFDHLPNKKLKVGNFLGKEDAIIFIKKSLD